jgi:predicted alpha/beta hydrolase family esterase
MPRRPTRSVPTVLINGTIATGTDDWPQWLAGQLTDSGREVRRCDAGPSLSLESWRESLTATLAGLPEDGFDVLAHSLGCLLWLHHAAAADRSPRPARVALVAPPSATEPPADWHAFYPVPLDIDAIRKAADGTVLVGGSNDPYCPAGVAQEYGTRLKMAATVIADGGALTAADGFGGWPAVLDWCGRDNLAFIA